MNHFILQLCTSYEKLTGRAMPVPAEALYAAPFALVAHGNQPDPVFCYANLTAQTLWEMDWERFTRTPSRLSAEADDGIQTERQALLKAALAKGYIADYAGIRISASGRRFHIKNTTLWNVMDADGTKLGQAALIPQWEFLDS